MKLYYTPSTSSLVPHIVAIEAGIPIQLVKVELPTKTIATEGDFWTINPKGYVPALEFDNGEVLTEGSAIVQYLADLKPETRLTPAKETLARVRLQEALNYISAELHKAYIPLFNPKTRPEVREEWVAHLRQRYAVIDKQLAGRKYLLGNEFTVADVYLFVATRWASSVELDLSDFTNLQAFQETVAARPAVQTAMKTEG